MKSRSKIALFEMNVFLKFDFQKKKRKQLRFSEVNYLNYTKKTRLCMKQLHFPQNKRKQEQAVHHFINYTPHSTVNLSNRRAM